MSNYIKNFKTFVAESIETNTKEIQLLDQKKALQEKLKQTEVDTEKTAIESQIAKLDIEIEKIRQIEDQEVEKNV
jgi:hypothetical protein